MRTEAEIREHCEVMMDLMAMPGDNCSKIAEELVRQHIRLLQWVLDEDTADTQFIEFRLRYIEGVLQHYGRRRTHHPEDTTKVI
jgi:hypothetical protein